MPKRSLPTRRSIKHENSNDSIINVRLDCITGRKRCSWFQARRIENIYFGIGFLSTAADEFALLLAPTAIQFLFSVETINLFTVTGSTAFRLFVSLSRWLRCVGWKTWIFTRKATIITLDFTLQRAFFLFSCAATCRVRWKIFFLRNFASLLIFYHRAAMSEPLTKRRQFHRSILLLWLVEC